MQYSTTSNVVTSSNELRISTGYHDVAFYIDSPSFDEVGSDIYLRFYAKSERNLHLSLFRYAYPTEEAFSFRMAGSNTEAFSGGADFMIRYGDSTAEDPATTCLAKLQNSNWALESKASKPYWIRFTTGVGAEMALDPILGTFVPRTAMQMGYGTVIGQAVMIECAFTQNFKVSKTFWVAMSSRDSQAEIEMFEAGNIEPYDLQRTSGRSGKRGVMGHCNIDGRYLAVNTSLHFASIGQDCTNIVSSTAECYKDAVKLLADDPSIFRCEPCPVDTYYARSSPAAMSASIHMDAPMINMDLKWGMHTHCAPCPMGFSTLGKVGASRCMPCPAGTSTRAVRVPDKCTDAFFRKGVHWSTDPVQRFIATNYAICSDTKPLGPPSGSSALTTTAGPDYYKCFVHGGVNMPMYSQAGCENIASNAKWMGKSHGDPKLYGECLKTTGGSHTWDKRGICATRAGHGVLTSADIDDYGTTASDACCRFGGGVYAHQRCSSDPLSCPMSVEMMRTPPTSSWKPGSAYPQKTIVRHISKKAYTRDNTTTDKCYFGQWAGDAGGDLNAPPGAPTAAYVFQNNVVKDSRGVCPIQHMASDPRASTWTDIGRSSADSWERRTDKYDDEFCTTKCRAAGFFCGSQAAPSTFHGHLGYLSCKQACVARARGMTEAACNMLCYDVKPTTMWGGMCSIVCNEKETLNCPYSPDCGPRNEYVARWGGLHNGVVRSEFRPKNEYPSKKCVADGWKRCGKLENEPGCTKMINSTADCFYGCQSALIRDCAGMSPYKGKALFNREQQTSMNDADLFPDSHVGLRAPTAHSNFFDGTNGVTGGRRGENDCLTLKTTEADKSRLEQVLEAVLDDAASTHSPTAAAAEPPFVLEFGQCDLDQHEYGTQAFHVGSLVDGRGDALSKPTSIVPPPASRRRMATFASTCVNVMLRATQNADQVGWFLYRTRLSGVDRVRSVRPGRGCQDSVPVEGSQSNWARNPYFTDKCSKGFGFDQSGYEYKEPPLTTQSEYQETFCDLEPGEWTLVGTDTNGNGWGPSGNMAVCEGGNKVLEATGLNTQSWYKTVRCFEQDSCSLIPTVGTCRVDKAISGIQSRAEITFTVGQVINCPKGYYCPSLHTRYPCDTSLSSRVICPEGSAKPVILPATFCPGPVAEPLLSTVGGDPQYPLRYSAVPCSTVSFGAGGIVTEVKRLVTIPGSDQIQIVITNAGNRMQVYDCRRMGGSKCVGVPMTKACMAGPKLCGSQTEEECFKQECNDDSDSNSDARTGDSLDIVYRYKLDAETSWIETQDGKPISHYWNEDWKTLPTGSSTLRFELDSTAVPMPLSEERKTVKAVLRIEWYNRGSDGPPPAGRPAAFSQAIPIAMEVKRAGALLVFPFKISQVLGLDKSADQQVQVWNVKQKASFKWTVKEDVLSKSTTCPEAAAAGAAKTVKWFSFDPDLSITPKDKVTGDKTPQKFKLSFNSNVPACRYETKLIVSAVVTEVGVEDKSEDWPVSVELDVEPGPTIPTNALLSTNSDYSTFVKQQYPIIITTRDRFNVSAGNRDKIYVSWIGSGGSIDGKHKGGPALAQPVVKNGVVVPSQYQAHVVPAIKGTFMIRVHLGNPKDGGGSAPELNGSPLTIQSRSFPCTGNAESNSDFSGCICKAGYEPAEYQAALAGTAAAANTDANGTLTSAAVPVPAIPTSDVPAAGTSGCMPCRADYFKTSSANSECRQCPAGSKGQRTGQTKKTDCVCDKSKRLFANFESAADNTDINCICEPNSRGDSSDPNFIKCESCAAGKHTDYTSFDTVTGVGTGVSTDRTVCVNCPRQFPVSSDTGLTPDERGCRACPDGEEPDETKSKCERCPLNTYSNDDAQGRKCKPCEANEVTLQTKSSSRAACICTAGYFFNTNAKENTRRICTKCPKGAFCEQGTQRVEDIRALPSFWRPSSQSIRFHKCLIDFHKSSIVDSISEYATAPGEVPLKGTLNMYANCLGGRSSTCAPVFRRLTGEKFFKPELEGGNREFYYPESFDGTCSHDISNSSATTKDGYVKPVAFCPSSDVVKKARKQMDDGDANIKFIVMYYCEWKQTTRGARCAANSRPM